MNVVSNTSPIIFLAKINVLEILTCCFDKVYIPDAVKLELNGLRLPSTIEIQTINDVGKSFVKGALGSLHIGELEAMVLAQELQADYVLLDDLLARRKAKRMEINVMGTIGILLFAHKKGFLSSQDMLSNLEQLTQKHGLYISPVLLKEIESSL
jgi:predicted nucleic acid-binding protein